MIQMSETLEWIVSIDAMVNWKPVKLFKYIFIGSCCRYILHVLRIRMLQLQFILNPH